MSTENKQTCENFVQFSLRFGLEMKQMEIFLLLFFLGAVSADIIDEKWTNFKSKFNKSYTNSKEESKRFEIFEENSKFISKHNVNKEKSFKVDVNRYADVHEVDLSEDGDTESR